MNTHFSIHNNIVQLWHAILSDFNELDQFLINLLSPDEIERANRFRFAIHRQRFIISRGLLRKTLSLYTGIPPEQIVFSYGSHGKPYLKESPLQIQFNTS